MAAMAQRGILEGWVLAALTTRDWTEPDARRPDRTRSYKAIAEYGGRVLRVVHWSAGPDIAVLTVHFDRNAVKPAGQP
jgi:hypothetical protein